MKRINFALVVAFVIVVLYAMSTAHADSRDQLKKLLKGDVVVAPGAIACPADNMGHLARRENATQTAPCVLIVHPASAFVLMLDADGHPSILYAIDPQTKKRKVIWVAGEDI
jgi:hypothetical protein